MTMKAAKKKAGSDPHAWDGWKCDDLTPDLCDLHVEEGTVSVRGVSIRYWKYSSPREPPSDDPHLKHKKVRGREEKSARKRMVPSSKELPVVVVNGGPGWAHNYMLPVRQLACRGSREVVFYDQGGTGESALPTEGTVAEDLPWLLDPTYYATEELPTLIYHLGYSDFHIVSHSWGTMVAQLYALDASPQGLRSIVLSGPISDAQLFPKSMLEEKGGHGGISSLPPYLQSRLRAVVEQEAWDSPEYQALDDFFNGAFLTRVQPMADCLVASLAGMNQEVYLGCIGPNDFAMSGTLQDFNTTGRLHGIHVPVLLSNGEYDFVRPALVDALEENLPVVERVLFSKSAHSSMLDDAGSMNDVVSDFLGRVETSLAQKKKFRPKGGKKWKTLANVVPMKLIGGDQSKYSVSSQSVLVPAMTFLLGLMFGVFMNKRQIHRLGYETI